MDATPSAGSRAAVHDRCPICHSGDLQAIFVKDGYVLDRCGPCRQVFVRNPPGPGALERFYSFATGYHVDFRDDADEIASRERLARRQLSYVARFCATPGRLLDVGASAGFFVAASRDAGWDASGVELSDDTARVAREVRGAEVTTGRLEDLDLEPGALDVITLWDVIEHLADPSGTMAIVSAAVKAGRAGWSSPPAP